MEDVSARGPALRCACCFIVPPDLLKRLSNRTDLSDDTRSGYRATFEETTQLLKLRDTSRIASLTHRQRSDSSAADSMVEPNIQEFDCQNRQSLPGILIPQPATSDDEAVRTIHDTTGSVAAFYKKVFGRNSIDGAGLDLVSSVHYRRRFQNAFWDGRQMVYGDGDNEIFSGFYGSPDVIGHELTHGITQYESGLVYEGEAGALNESISDVFGASFHQWLRNWDASEDAGWLIGAGIMGPTAAKAGRTCLRDMANPAAAHCLSPQPSSYQNFDPTADVHVNSGIPNKAFVVFARAVGGRSWEKAAGVWYRACTDGLLPSAATIAQFARRTLAAARAVGVEEALVEAWESVDVPVLGEA